MEMKMKSKPSRVVILRILSSMFLNAFSTLCCMLFYFFSMLICFLGRASRAIGARSDYHLTLGPLRA